MPLTLDQIFIPACERRITSTFGVLEKVRTYAKENNISEGELLATRFIEDMWALPNQIQGMWAHSAYAIEQVKTGEYHPNPNDVPTTWEGMYEMLKKARAGLPAVDDGELEKIAGETVYFVFDKPLFKFTVQNFLLSFSMPNVHFHATTAYDLLRMKGADIGKYDFLGNLPTESM